MAEGADKMGLADIQDRLDTVPETPPAAGGPALWMMPAIKAADRSTTIGKQN